MSFQEYKDSFGTYYQFNNIKDETVTIFIHGVGLDNTMWYPQKKFFSKNTKLVPHVGYCMYICDKTTKFGLMWSLRKEKTSPEQKKISF